jgi:hypothetical protein
MTNLQKVRIPEEGRRRRISISYPDVLNYVAVTGTGTGFKSTSFELGSMFYLYHDPAI